MRKPIRTWLRKFVKIASICLVLIVASWYLWPTPKRYIDARRIPYLSKRPHCQSLIYAIEKQDEPEVRRLLSLGVSPNSCAGQNDEDFEIALVRAVKTNNLSITRLLLSRGAYVNDEEPWELTSLMEASRSGNPEMVQLLLDYGAEVNIGDDLMGTSLLYAIAEMLTHSPTPGQFKNNLSIIWKLRGAGAKTLFMGGI